MGPARPSGGAWSRKAWILVTTLTAIGLLGIFVDFAAFFAIHGPLTGGCGGLAGLGLVLMAVAALLVLVYGALIGALTVTGVIFFWKRSRWGPRLLIPANLLSMAFFFWSPVDPGQATWATALVLLGAAPAVAVGLLVWSLVSRADRTVWLGELVTLGLIALFMVPAFVDGISADVAAGLAPPPQLVAHAGCGSTTAAAITP